MASQAAYPLRVEADLEPGLSRWLWLVKWLLAIPHFVVLWFLWVAYAVLTVVAFLAILVTGRYPRSIFDFNVGVLRWSWRVADYAFGVLATDRYPPFTLAEVPDYPAHLQVAYPERLSRGLVLVKWWLLAIPHYLIVGILAGGGSWVAWNAGRNDWAPGLIGLLVLIAVLILAFTGQYPRSLFDLILGLNRWVLRVFAYAGLMTDEYPPFRLDTGGREPAGTLTIPPGPPAPTGTGSPPAPPAADGGGGRAGWSTGRIVAVVVGALLAVVAIGSLGGGGFGLWADQTQRDTSGFLTTSTRQLTTAGYALSSETMHLGDGPGWLDASRAVGTVRIRVTPAQGSGPVFVGIAPAGQAAAYLTGVPHTVVRDVGDLQRAITPQGTAPPAPPAAQRFWAASSVGSGTQTVTWPARSGSWTLVAMNVEGTRGLDLRADVGATVPWLLRAAVGLLVVGAVLLVAGVLLIVLPVIGASRTPRRQEASP